MPEKEKNIKFDKNQFVQDLIQSGRIVYFGRQFHALFDFDVPRKKTEYSGPETEEDLKRYVDNGNKAYANAMTWLYEAYKNPKGPETEELRKIWSFIKPITYDGGYFINNFRSKDFAVLLRRLDVFDEKSQLCILKHLNVSIPETAKETKDVIFTKILNNSLASADDKSKAAVWFASKDHGIARDVIEDLKKELDKEIKADIPDTKKIELIVNNANNIVYYARKSLQTQTDIKNPLDRDYMEAMYDLFNMKNILAGDSEYVVKNQQTLEERAISAEKRVEIAEKTIEKMKDKEEKQEEELNESKRQIERLKDSLNARQQLLNDLQDELNQKTSVLKSIKMEIARQQVGLLGNGDKLRAIQNFVAEKTVNLK